MTGTLLGSYELLEKLGQGGMGAVYRAQHRRIPRLVAIKLLLPEFSSDAAIVDRFFAGARAAATINHPSIVEIVDCDVQDFQPLASSLWVRRASGFGVRAHDE